MFVEFNNTNNTTKPIHIKDAEAKKEIENEAFLHFGTKQEPIVEKPLPKEEKTTPAVAVKPTTNYSTNDIVFYIQLIAPLSASLQKFHFLGTILELQRLVNLH
jgi:hypothetical protein